MKAKTDVRKRIESARRSFQSGEYDRALQDIDEALRLDESNTEALSLREQIAAATQREAVAMAAEAVRRAAGESDPDRCIEILQAAAIRNPEDQHLQMLLVLNESRRDVLAALAARARFFDRKRRFDDALEQLRLLENLQPAYPGLKELRGTILRHKEHPEEIVEETPPPPVVTEALAAEAVAAPLPAPELVPAPSAPVEVKPPAAPPPAPAPRPTVLAPQSKSRTVWAGLAMAAVLITAAMAYFINRGANTETEGKFQLALEPADARLEIDGKPQDPASLSLNPGSYKVRVTRPGYKTLEQEVAYRGGPLRLALEPLKPVIRIDTNLTGGEYSVDGGPPKPLEEGQANLGDLPPGSHQLKVTLPKYGDSTAEVVTAIGQLPRFVSAAPAKDVASFAISSFDTGASLQSSVPNLSVKLESGEELGKTDQPVQVKGTSGGEQRLVIGDGGQQQLVTAMFDSRPEFLWVLRGTTAAAGSVRVTVDQDDVSVRIDGKLAAARLKSGEPHSFRDLSPGNHEVRVEKPGYVADPLSKRITVANGREERVGFRLMGFTTVEIRGAPPGARVLINSAAAGTVGSDGSGRFQVAAKADSCRLELKQENSVHKPVEKPCRPGETVAFTGEEVKMAPSGFLVWEKSLPQGATITATRKPGGEKMPLTPPRAELPVGKYQVTVTAPGYKSRSDEVNVIRGTGSLMESDLEKEK